MEKKKDKKSLFFTNVTPEQRERFVLRTQELINAEYDIEIGNFDIEEIFEIFLDEVGSAIYNQGGNDMKSFLSSRFNDSLDDSYTLGID